MNAQTPSDETPEVALDLIYVAIGEVNPLLPTGEEITPGPATPLAKPEGPLDSLGLVNLIVAVEGKVQGAWGRSAGLMEALEIPAERSPFRTVETLRRFLVEGAPAGGAGAPGTRP
ncbi:MAG: hypothetical protein EA351_08780 [Gemmatimonadales bacterium]|nr:MAG: hypothetical protein EA351_08780 [Gemmatimonadales bacterium]